ncbi:UTP4 small subunit processome component l(3)72Dn [Leptinotarsa decemlineata]|uniref:UTP4 small subunit processome component l(3)72Dn n=1 Tax=Leptinotarsa decemlineata TaxID=7539 RepID=UPI003D306424
MSQFKIHNVRFYNPEPRAIRCMSLHRSSKKLAVSRSDASIEIWNLNNIWFLERTISSTAENFSIEGLAWCGNKLFSTGLHGLLVEYNLYRLCLEKKWAVTGEAAFCLDVDKEESRIAVGTEQGYLNIFSLNEDGVSFEKFCDKQEGRIMCLKFSYNGKFVVSGSIDAIRIWDVQSGHAIHKMTTGRSETNKPTIVWCVEVTEDFTIISGDSRGRLTFWDGNIGSQVESYQSHRSDILAISLSDNSLYCAGADPNIINYQKISVKGGAQKWVKSIQRKIHDHDVNALVICDNKLYSGGADGYLSCSFHPPKTLLKLPPLLQDPCVHVSQEAKYVMLQYPKHIELWGLGKSQNTEASYRGMVSLEKDPKKLLVLQRVGKGCDDEEREGVICCCVSDDGHWIMYSTSLGIRLFQFLYEENVPNFMKVADLEHENEPCIRSIFTPNNCQMITAPNTGGLIVYDLHKNGRASVSQTIKLKDKWDSITFMTISACGKYLIIGDPTSNIAIFTWMSKMKQWVNHCKLPKYKCPPTAMAVHPTMLYLIIAYSDNKIIEYDIRKKQLTQFSRQQNEVKSRGYPFRNITFDPRAEHIIILHDDSSITIINKQKNSAENKSKIAKVDGSEKSELSIQTVKKYKHLVHLEWLGEDEMIAVEVNPIALIEQLPPAFSENTFGSK